MSTTQLEQARKFARQSLGAAVPDELARKLYDSWISFQRQQYRDLYGRNLKYRRNTRDAVRRVKPAPSTIVSWQKYVIAENKRITAAGFPAPYKDIWQKAYEFARIARDEAYLDSVQRRRRMLKHLAEGLLGKPASFMDAVISDEVLS